MGLLEYFTVDDASGKVKRLKQESPNAAGAYMADHSDRYTCGRTGTMFYKLTADGKRLPIPKQNKVVKSKEELMKDAGPAKKPAKKKRAQARRQARSKLSQVPSCPLSQAFIFS